MLTHQNDRPEKCPIQTCDYHVKGFARKYDKNRHTLSHYNGTMVCGFCPGPGSAAEKSFNRADVFKRHLTSVHGVEQTPPNSRKRYVGSSRNRRQELSGLAADATGQCSTCSQFFANAQVFYEHLDNCVLSQVGKIHSANAQATKPREVTDGEPSRLQPVSEDAKDGDDDHDNDNGVSNRHSSTSAPGYTGRRLKRKVLEFLKMGEDSLESHEYDGMPNSKRRPQEERLHTTGNKSHDMDLDDPDPKSAEEPLVNLEKEGTKMQYPCDYTQCMRLNIPFTRKEQLREHYRDIHKEDLQIRSEVGPQDTEKPEWPSELNSWWRCDKCLERNKKASLECPGCKDVCASGTRDDKEDANDATGLNMLSNA